MRNYKEKLGIGNFKRVYLGVVKRTMCTTSNGHTNGHQGPKPLVLCGPSGAGKTSIMRKLTDEFQNSFGFSVSHTTRNPRQGESCGKDYHFVSRETFEKLVEDGAFLEHAVFGGNMYGTSRAAVETVMRTGKICILDIDVQGVKNIKRTDLNPDFVFVLGFEAEKEGNRDRGLHQEAALSGLGGDCLRRHSRKF